MKSNSLSNQNLPDLPPIAPAKRMALYAPVSTKEQTEGKYPSCESQVEELQAFCDSKGWEAAEIIKDEGVSAGSLKREGLSQLRYLVETQQINGIVCTWYDRLVRTRDFYILDSEFRTHDVDFVTLHDPTDRKTASGRFMETLLVAAKTYEREQTAEKVRVKMQMRKEKGMWNGGCVPFGFLLNEESQIYYPDPKKQDLVVQMFQTYLDNGSDFVVRDWLKAHGILTAEGKASWTPSTIQGMLTNRRYIAEIEINRPNKGKENLPELESYRVVPAPPQPIVTKELFDLAQAVRKEKASLPTHRGGKTRSYSQNKCGRVYILQGRMICGVCRSAMTPHYTYHKPGGKRKSECYIHYYECTQQVKGVQENKHSNRVSSKNSEAWLLERITRLVESELVVERALERARANCELHLQPQKAALSLTESSLQENQQKINEIVEAVSGGGARGSLIEILNEKAYELKIEREKLRVEQRLLTQALLPMDTYFDTMNIKRRLKDFHRLAQTAEPQELQRLLRLIIRRIEWFTDGRVGIEFYQFAQPGDGSGGKPKTISNVNSPMFDWFATSPMGDISKTKTQRKFRWVFRFMVLSRIS